MSDVALAGRVAVVTGGAAGIGGGISRALAAAGAHVVIDDIDGASLRGTIEDIESTGGAATAVVGDVREPATIAELAEVAADVAAGPIDVLVNNVGDYRPSTGLFAGSDPATWQALYETNLHHVFACTQAFVGGMIERGRGSIVNVSTVEALRGAPGNSVYSAFNAGVNAFTRSLAVELGRHGVRVNAIAPDMADTLQTPAASMLRGRDPELVGHWIPLGRFGAPADYGDVVCFLAGDGARFVTGQIIAVDGGTSAASGWYLRRNGRRYTNLPDQP
jgi:NAD(P)-dependent dehydrogenase (short-subunit alcohol dehydrogenase family)